jgi:hypothetical protein
VTIGQTVTGLRVFRVVPGRRARRTAPACSIVTAGDFECSGPSDCNGGRQCVDGLCVDPNAPDARGPDGSMPRPDAEPECPPQCTACDPEERTCVIDCSIDNTNCDGMVTCPEGFACDIRCNIQNSCRNGVSCIAAKSCVISCSGTSACRDVTCAGVCVTCSGFQACRHQLRSVARATSSVRPAELLGIVRTEFQCDTGLGCTSPFPGCNTADERGCSALLRRIAPARRITSALRRVAPPCGG